LLQTYFIPAPIRQYREYWHTNQRIVHSCQAFKFFLTVSPSHKTLTKSTWALEFSSGGHFQHFHQHAHFCFLSFSFEKERISYIHFLNHTVNLLYFFFFYKKPIPSLLAELKDTSRKSNTSPDYLTYCL